MANAYVICTQPNRAKVVEQMEKVHLKNKEVEAGKVNTSVFYTEAKFFEAGGKLEQCDVVLTSEMGYELKLRQLAGDVK